MKLYSKQVTVRGKSEWTATGIWVKQGDPLRITASGTIRPWRGAPKVTPNGNDSIRKYPHHEVYTPAPFMALIGKIGNKLFTIKSRYTGRAVASGQLYLTSNDTKRQYRDNSGSFRVSVTHGGLPSPLPPPEHEECDCERGIHACDNPLTANPINLRTGEKQEKVTDLVVHTPAGELAFTRNFRQNKLATHTFMGLGWSHNHNLYLEVSGSDMWAYLPGGGRAKFKADGSNYKAAAGGTSKITVNSGNTDEYYTLESAGQAFVFNNQKKLRFRRWSNGEAWEYTYVNDKLDNVADGYGRKLQFTYIDNTAFDNGQLWRVGDQTATGLDTATPSGRYVEFGYVEEHQNGSVAANPDALLETVRDVRGETWRYQYYGKARGENNRHQSNFLVDVKSPPINGSPITRKHLSYQVSGATVSQVDEALGDDGSSPLLEKTYKFQPNGKNLTEEILFEGDAQELKTVHYFAGGVYAGPENPRGDLSLQTLASNYRPVTQQDANGNQTELEWDSDGQSLQKVTDAAGHVSAFGYNADATLYRSVDAQNRRTIYQYESVTAPRQPKAIFISTPLSTPLPTNGDMELDSNWSAVGTPTTHARVDGTGGTQVDAGSYARHVETAAANEGIQSATFNLSANQPYLIVGRVYAASGTVKMQLVDNSATELEAVSTTKTAEWETLVFVYGPTSNQTGARLRFLSSGGAAEFYVDSVEINQHLRQQTYVYDSKGRTTEERVIDPDDGTTVLQKTTRVYATSGTGHGLLESVTQVDLTNAANNISTTYTYDSAGRVIKTQKSSLLGSCQFTYSVYDDAGNVLATVCGRESATIPTTVAAARALYDATDPAKFTVTTHAYDALGRRTQTTTQAGSPSEQTTRTVYDALDRVTRTIDNYVASASVPNPATAAHSAFDHGSDANQNRVTDTAYNARGLVRSQTDVLGHVTLIGYDAAGRLVKTIQSASQPSYNNDYTGTAADPDLSAYPASSNPDQDAITEQVYDANGNLVQTIDPSGQSHFTVYDALNRPVKTIRSAKAAASSTLNPGATAANDPRSDDYAPSTDPDRDLIEATEYDALGRVIRTRRLLENRPSAIWETTLYGYDTLGRQVKVIRSASQADYDLAADPDLSAYTAADAADQDLISTTTYDNQGRVSYPTDVNGAQTRYVYDGLNRQVKTVNNYVVQGTSDPAAWVWDASDSRWERASTGNVAVEHGPANDQNHISQTVYDSDGRVQSTRDVLGRTTYTVYDASSRPIRRIANYVPSGTSNPANWVWSTANSRWEDGTGTAIPRGTNADQNTITETVYNNEGQVQQTIDGRRNVSYNLYDETGRQIIRIGNYVAQGTTNPKDWRWNATANRWESSAGQAVDHGPANDQNTISHTTYDLAGRVRATRAAAGIETRYTYDKLGRRIKTVHNYVDGVFDAAHPDQDLISQTTYNKAGQVIQTSDARGTKTTFSYDAAGRRLTVTQAAGTYLETTNYTCYDKAGRVLRTIQNWQATRISPDARRPDGTWQFNPRGHGSRNDRDLITAFAYDAAGRRTKVTDPAGNVTTTTYDKDGSIDTTTDAEGTVSAYRYDGLRRRNRVIQNYVAQGTSDPADWVWHETRSKWERSATDATAIAHNTDNDQNVIVQVTHDLAGRITSLRDPRGNLTRYEYDQRNRRTKRTNPLAHEWRTAYADLSNGGTQTTQTYPGLATGASYDVTREFDRLGRLNSIDYNSTTTPDVAFAYDIAGNRTQMTERTGTTDNRITHFGYDDQRRLTSVGFDSNGDGTVDETVSYAYDAGGLRTQMTLPGSKTIAYSYDANGRLIGLTAWGNQHSDFHYDKAGRHVATQRPNGLLSDYAYDPASRLRRVRHRAGSSLRGQFNYTVDGRGNRTRAFERLAQSTTVTATYNKSASQVTFTRGTWTDDGAYKKTTQFSGRMQIAYTGDEALLTIGTGPDHGQFDLYINDNYWRRFDAYTAQPGERVLHIPVVPTPPGATSGVVEIRNRSDRHHRSTGHVFRFKQLAVINATYNERTIDYTYDGLSRLQQANYNTGQRIYDYNFDLAGNRTQEALSGTGVTAKTTDYTYNAANQLTNDGINTLTYDPNGNLTNDGTNAYTWDRANRLANVDNGTPANLTAYTYDGLGNRIQQTVSSVVTNYLLDLQPGLAKVIGDSDGNRYVHSPRGIHAMQDNTGNWQYTTQDGLGSVRSLIDSTLGVDTTQSYNPYGEPFGTVGNFDTPFAFTGEQVDSTGQVYLRARYYNPSMGGFPSLDPFEGMMQRPMSLNGYSWVEGNTPNRIDPSGRTPSCQETPVSCDFLLAVQHLPFSNPLRAPRDDSYIDETVMAPYLDYFDGSGNQVYHALTLTVTKLAKNADQKGLDDASRNLLHFLGNSGAPMSNYPVDKMLSELPELRYAIHDVLGSSVWSAVNNHGPGSPTDSSRLLDHPYSKCRLWTYNTNPWTQVGKRSPVNFPTYDIYPNVDNTATYFELLNIGEGDPHLNELDWFLSMNSFHFSLGISAVIDEETNDGVVCFRVEIEDYYAWYSNEGTGASDNQMGILDGTGYGQHYPISGVTSLVTCIDFNSKTHPTYSPKSAGHPHYDFH